MIFEKPVIPEILTDKNWQKNKGLIAKSQGETGISVLMRKLATDYVRVNWKLFSPATSIPAAERDLYRMRETMKEAEQAKTGPCDKVAKSAIALSQAAAKLAHEWEKSKLIPASSRKHAKNVADAAADFAVDVTDSAKLFCEIEEELALAQKNAELAHAVGERFGKPADIALSAVMKAAKQKPFVHADVLRVYNDNLKLKLLVLAAASEGIAKRPGLKADWEKIAQIAKHFANYKDPKPNDWPQITGQLEKLIIMIIQSSHI